MRRTTQIISCVLAWSVMLSSALTHAQGSFPTDIPVQSNNQSREELQQLVAPIALYPDALVAQILAAATYPDQVVEADRFIQQHPELKVELLASQVDPECWDPSVKALTAFPAVLANMDKNLAWTSSLGDAYVNHESDVMNAIQVLRRRAKQAGNLQTNADQTVTTKGKTIVIEPASSDVVYLPEYNPWLVYGAPMVAWPGWYWYPGLFWDSPGIGFGLGFGIGFFGGFGWGWNHWGADWHHRAIDFDHDRYVSRGRTFINRGRFGDHGRSFGRGTGLSGTGLPRGAHGPGPVRLPGTSGIHGAAPHSGAFGGFNHGGVTSGFGARGRSSFGGGFHGGGFHGGGRR